MKLKAYTPYVNGVIGQEFKLTFMQKIRILFCEKLTVILVAEKLRKKER